MELKPTEQKQESALEIGKDVQYYEVLIAEHLSVAHVKMIESVNLYLEAVSRRRSDPTLQVQTQSGIMSITKIIERRFASMREAVETVRAYESMLEVAKGEGGDKKFRDHVDELLTAKPLELEIQK